MEESVSMRNTFTTQYLLFLNSWGVARLEHICRYVVTAGAVVVNPRMGHYTPLHFIMQIFTTPGQG